MKNTSCVALLLLPLAACSAQQQVKVIHHSPGLRFARWTDPRENAFSAETPSGWRTAGGLFRVSPIDTRQSVSALSPDGILVAMGDPEFATFLEPNQILNSTGFPEGSRYPNGYGGHIPVMRYVPGPQFAEQYVHSRAARGCSNLNIVDRRMRPDLAQSLNRILATMPGVFMQMTMGEVTFTCTIGGNPMRGYYLAGTVESRGTNGLGMWFVQHLYGYLAPADKAGVAQAALRRMVATHQVNPGWAAGQSRTTMQSSQIMARSNAEISKIVSDSYWSRAESLNRTFQNGANARRGTTDVTDPSTGETWNVYGGSRYYWRIPGSDTVIGTDVYTPPAGNAVPLNEYTGGQK